MATKKEKETKAKDNKTGKSKKATTKPKVTKKEEPKAVENVEVNEEPVVVETVVENTVEEVTVDVTIDSVEKISDVKEIEEAFKNDEIPDNITPEPTEEQIAEMQEMVDEDDAKLEYAQATLEKVQEVTQQEEPEEEKTYEITDEQVNGVLDEQERVKQMEEEAKEYIIPVDENGSNTVSTYENASSGTCTEEKQVQELVEQPEQPKQVEKKPKKKKWLGTVYRWFGAQIDL